MATITHHDTTTEIHSPVRIDAALGKSEDLDRQPDGVPHSVVGMVAGFSTILAILLAAMFIAGGTTVKVAAVLMLVVAVPVLISGLNRKAGRDRDPWHPSR